MRHLLACSPRGGSLLLPARSASSHPRPFTALRPSRRWSRPLMRVGAAQQQEAAAAAASSPAAQSVEQGLALFEAGKYEEALPLFLNAQKQSPNADEARAALYNAACAQTKLRQWQAAADSVLAAVNDYDLKLSVALKDPDLEALRERREWVMALNQVKGGVSEEQYIKLRSEAKAPFRLTRIYLFGALAGGAGLGLIIIATQLAAAISAGDDLEQPLQNLAINGAALALFGFLVSRDLSKEAADKRAVQREEELGRLQVTLSGDRILPLAAFRGTTRPVIVAGSKGQVSRALAAAEPYKDQLRERGVSVMGITLSEDDAQERLRRLKMELSGESIAPAVPSEPEAKGFGAADAKKPAPKPAAPSQQLTKKDKRWQLEPSNLGEWAAWVEEQKKIAGVVDANSIYVQVQLDGTVRASGVGIPPWKQFVADLPEVGSVRTKFTDGSIL